MKQTAERIFRETLAAIDIPAAVERKLARTGSTHPCRQFPDRSARFRIPLWRSRSAKRPTRMARGLVNVLAPDFRADGILVVPATLAAEMPGWRIFRRRPSAAERRKLRGRPRDSRTAGAVATSARSFSF